MKAQGLEGGNGQELGELDVCILPNGLGVISKYQAGCLEIFVKNFQQGQVFKIDEGIGVVEKRIISSMLSRDEKFIIVAILFGSNDRWYYKAFNISLPQGIVEKICENILVPFRFRNWGLLDHNAFIFTFQKKGANADANIVKTLDLATSDLRELKWDKEFKNDITVVYPVVNGIFAIKTWKKGNKNRHGIENLYSLLIVDVLEKKILSKIPLGDRKDLKSRDPVHAWSICIGFHKIRKWLVLGVAKVSVEVRKLGQETEPFQRWIISTGNFESVAVSDEGQVAYTSSSNPANFEFYFLRPGEQCGQPIIFGKRISAASQCFKGNGHFITENTCLLGSSNIVFIGVRNPTTLVWSIIQCFDFNAQPFSHFDWYQCLDANLTIRSLIKNTQMNQILFHVKRNEYNEADLYVKNALAQDQNDAQIWCALGNIRLLQGNNIEAFQAFDKALHLNSNYSDSLLGRGTAMLELGHHKEALQDFEGTLKLEPQNYEAWKKRSEANKKLGFYDEAIRDLDKVLALYPDDKEFDSALTNTKFDAGKIKGFLRAEIWRERMNLNIILGRQEEAVNDASELLKIFPKDASLWLARGVCYEFNSRYEEAIRDIDRSIELNSKNHEAFVMRGKAKFKLGQHEAATRDFNEAKRINPNDELLRETLDELLSESTVELKRLYEVKEIYESALSTPTASSQNYTGRAYAPVPQPATAQPRTGYVAGSIQTTPALFSQSPQKAVSATVPMKTSHAPMSPARTGYVAGSLQGTPTLFPQSPQKVASATVPAKTSHAPMPPARAGYVAGSVQGTPTLFPQSPQKVASATVPTKNSQAPMLLPPRSSGHGPK